MAKKTRRRVVARTLVPVIHHSLLVRVEALVDRLATLKDEFDEVEMCLSASLSVLRGDNHPEGWMEIVEVEDE
jgi:hypothetical protein